jgi:hypothetical protein
MLYKEIRGWSKKFSASTIDVNTIGKIFFPLSWYICHKHLCEIASHSIKYTQSLFILTANTKHVNSLCGKYVEFFYAKPGGLCHNQ